MGKTPWQEQTSRTSFVDNLVRWFLKVIYTVLFAKSPNNKRPFDRFKVKMKKKRKKIVAVTCVTFRAENDKLQFLTHLSHTYNTLAQRQIPNGIEHSFSLYSSHFAPTINCFIKKICVIKMCKSTRHTFRCCFLLWEQYNEKKMPPRETKWICVKSGLPV